MKTALLLTACLFLAGCDSRREKLTGHYISLSIDTPEDRSVYYDLGHGEGIGRIGPGVFAVGCDDKFIVAMQHPASAPSETNYFYLEIAKDGKDADPRQSVTGPLSEAEFKTLQAKLNLPAFTRTYR